MRYIRGVQRQRDVRPLQHVHKLAINEIRPPMTAAKFEYRRAGGFPGGGSRSSIMDGQYGSA